MELIIKLEVAHFEEENLLLPNPRFSNTRYNLKEFVEIVTPLTSRLA